MWTIDSIASTASKEASAYGSSMAFRCWKTRRSGSDAARASSLAWATCSWLTEMPVTAAPVRRAIRSAGPPTPQPTSSRWDPAPIRSRSVITSVSRSVASSKPSSLSGVSQ